LLFVFHSEKFEAKNVKFEASEALSQNIVTINTNINANHILLSLCVIFLWKKLQLQKAYGSLRNETKRNGTLRNGTLRNGTLRNENIVKILNGANKH